MDRSCPRVGPEGRVLSGRQADFSGSRRLIPAPPRSTFGTAPPLFGNPSRLHSPTGSAYYYPTYDASGNVSEYLDAAGNVAAHYEYAPFGKTVAATGPLADAFAFRFSTKYLDAETGLLYYGYRHLDPETGRWLSRDPLGEQGGTNLYAFVGNGPMGHIDALGLAMYAFDGTWNDREKMSTNPKKNVTNVAILAGLYKDPSRVRYLAGPGTDPFWKFWKSPPLLGGVFGKGSSGKVDQMYEYFRTVYKPGDSSGDKEITIVGFSCGAAQARAFANKIHDEAIKRGEEVPHIQFVGLFDTVNMTAGLNQAIPPNVGYVAHAVALKEKRRAFPLTEIFLRDPESDVAIAVRGFFGAHSDIGGGYKDNWISNAALLWMWGQMSKAGVTTVSRPGDNVTNDFNQYLEYEGTIFPWHDFLERNQPGYNRPPPWHNSSTWFPWFFDRLFPQCVRKKVSQ